MRRWQFHCLLPRSSPCGRHSIRAPAEALRQLAARPLPGTRALLALESTPSRRYRENATGDEKSGTAQFARQDSYKRRPGRTSREVAARRTMTAARSSGATRPAPIGAEKGGRAGACFESRTDRDVRQQPLPGSRGRCSRPRTRKLTARRAASRPRPWRNSRWLPSPGDPLSANRQPGSTPRDEREMVLRIRPRDRK